MSNTNQIKHQCEFIMLGSKTGLSYIILKANPQRVFQRLKSKAFLYVFCYQNTLAKWKFHDWYEYDKRKKITENPGIVIQPLFIYERIWIKYWLMIIVVTVTIVNGGKFCRPNYEIGHTKTIQFNLVSFRTMVSE